MIMSEIKLIVHFFLLKILSEKDPNAVSLNQLLISDLGLSSLDVVLLVTNTFKKTQVPMTMLTEEDLNLINTGADLVELLSNYKASL